MTAPDPRAPPSAGAAPSRGRRGLLAGLAVLVLLGVAASLLWLDASGDGSSGPVITGVPSTSAEPSESSPPTDTAPDVPNSSGPAGEPEDDFAEFVAACADSFEGWRPGQATYPRELRIDLGGSRTYTARIDIRPEAQREPPPDPETATADLEVRCGIGARLVAVGSSVSVDRGDWVLARFGQPGTVQWDWTVTAKDAQDAEVRLELRPAVAAVDGSYTVPAEANPNTTTTSFTTDVDVQTSWMQQVGVWFDDNWPIVTTVAVALGGAVLGLIAWIKKVRVAIAPRAPAPRRAPGPARRKPARRR